MTRTASKPRTPQRTTHDPVDETPQAIEQLAIRVSGNARLGRAWMTRPNDLLRRRTPLQAIQDGDARLALGILYSTAGL